MTSEQKQLLVEIIPFLQENGKEITMNFYKQLLAENPEMLDQFSKTNLMDMGRNRGIATDKYDLFKFIDELDENHPMIQKVAGVHRSLGVTPEQYPTIKEHLVGTIIATMGDDATEEIRETWEAAYDLLAELLIKAEKVMYEQINNEVFVDFTVIEREELGDSFRLKLVRKDGKPLISYVAGQFITLRAETDGHIQNRHYSLIKPFDENGYEIIVKLVSGGTVSTILNQLKVGDEIEGALPAGEFKQLDCEKHIFVGSGTGFAPMQAIALGINDKDNCELYDLHQTAGYELLKGAVACVKQISVDDLRQLEIDKQAGYYLCGLTTDVKTVKQYLLENGVELANISVELFVPTAEVKVYTK